MEKLQSQGVHHITLVGADRQTSIDFWEGVLGMPFVFEQPNLDKASESHLYFDPGDGRLITIFTDESRKADPARGIEYDLSLMHDSFRLNAALVCEPAEGKANATRLSWTATLDSGANPYRRYMSLFVKKPLGKLFDEGLGNIKRKTEARVASRLTK